MVNFKPIRKTTISGEIIDQIIAMVRTGRLNPGERLPSERQLSDFFNVGRSSIREALKALETIGITKRTRGGTVISTLEGNPSPLFWLDLHGFTIQEVFETRKLMEIELAGLAAQRATPQQIKEITGSIIETDVAREAIVADVSFHRALVKSAQNSVFSKIYDLITGSLFQTHRYYSYLEHRENQADGLKGFLREVTTQHKEILQEVERHDADRTREAMKRHLDFTEKELLGRVIFNLSDLSPNEIMA